MAEFESGAREEIRWVETDQHDVSSVTDMTVLPHGGNPTGPHKPYDRGPTDEVASDLQVQDNPARSFTVPFSMQNVARYGAHDLPLQQVVNFRWLTAFDTGVVIDIGSDAPGNKLVGPAGTFDDLAAHVPCVVWLCRGGATPIAGQPVVATEVLAAGAELVLALGGANGITLTTVAAGGDVQVMHSGVIKLGTELIFAMIERAQVGLGHFYAGFGLIGTQYDFNGSKGSDPTQSFNFMGKDADNATATFGTGTQTPAPGTKAFNFGSDLKHFREGGTAVPLLFLQSLQYSIQAGVAAVDPAGIDGPYAHEKNRFQITGTATYFSNDAGRDVGQKANDKADSSLIFALQNTVSGITRAYVDWLPHVQYDQTEQQGGGNDSILTTPTNFMVAKHPTLGLMWSRSRFTGVPLTL
jgi:hypothetical protein